MIKTENFKKTTKQPDFQRRQKERHDARSGRSGTLLYFAYGSNMNRNQMTFRCPDAEVAGTVQLSGYRLAFRENGGGTGVATVLPEPDSFVDGVLWRISERDERRLDHYEGFPYIQFPIARRNLRDICNTFF